MTEASFRLRAVEVPSSYHYLSISPWCSYQRLSTTDETVGLDKELDDKDKRQGAGDAPPGEEDDADDHLVADYHSDGDSAESEEDEEKDEIDEPEEITKVQLQITTDCLVLLCFHRS